MKKKRQQAASKGRGDRGCRHRLGPALSLAFLLAAACGTRAGNEKPKSVAECQPYVRDRGPDPGAANPPAPVRLLLLSALPTLACPRLLSPPHRHAPASLLMLPWR